MASETYELNSISDMLKIPPDRLPAMLRDLEYAIQMCHFVGGEGAPPEAFKNFVWTDDGNHSVHVDMGMGEGLKLVVTGDEHGE